MDYKIFGNRTVNDVIKSIESSYPTTHCLFCTDGDLNVGDYVYLIDNYYNEYAFKVQSKIYADGYICLYVIFAKLEDICLYGSNSMNDNSFRNDIEDYYNKHIKGKLDFNDDNEETFSKVVNEIISKLNLDMLPFNAMCMRYRVSEVLANILGINWHRPIFYSNY